MEKILQNFMDIIKLKIGGNNETNQRMDGCSKAYLISSALHISDISPNPSDSIDVITMCSVQDVITGRQIFKSFAGHDYRLAYKTCWDLAKQFEFLFHEQDKVKTENVVSK